MRPCELTAPQTLDDALDSPGVFLAGGTTLVDLMKLDVLTPSQVQDIDALPLPGIGTTDTTGGLRIGALERMSDVAAHPGMYPVITRALLQERLPAAAEHGQHRRQPAAAHPVRLLPRRRLAV